MPLPLRNSHGPYEELAGRVSVKLEKDLARLHEVSRNSRVGIATDEVVVYQW